MKIMARKKKNILNQTSVTIPKEDIEMVEELHNINLVDEAKKMASEETGIPTKDIDVVIKSKEEISLKDSGEKLANLKENESLETEKNDEKVVEETPRPAGIRSLDKDVLKRLTHRERRFFERTGILPK